jgi:arylsulfatase A-like enzyme
LSHFSPLSTAAIRRIDRQFRKRVQSVQAVDRMIGRIEALLVAKGLADNTYIVFSSDNGLHMGEHRLLPGKLTAFDTDIKVPLIVTGPDVATGQTIAQMTENVDLCPTFERLGGAPVPSNVDGHSLVTLLRGRPARNWRREILVEHHGRVLDTGDPDLPTQGSGNPPSYEAIRTPSSLYVEYSTGEREYYDLNTDPFELRNVAANLPLARRLGLHRTLMRIERCHGGRACWRAQHGGT